MMAPIRGVWWRDLIAPMRDFGNDVTRMREFGGSANDVVARRRRRDRFNVYIER